MFQNFILDDDKIARKTPVGYTRAYSVEELMTQLQTNLDPIGVITFDNDLGTSLEGYDALKMMLNHGYFAQHYNIHSANVVAVNNMVAYLKSAMRTNYIPNATVTTYSLQELTQKGI